MCVNPEKGYKKCACPTSDECLFYGDMSQMCISTGEVCNKPWLLPDWEEIKCKLSQ